MSLYKKFAFRGLLAGAFLALLAIVGGFATNSKPLVAQSSRDCDSNAIINCGAMTVDELMTKYSQNATKDLPQIYSAFGISPTQLKTKAAIGQVHKDGTVWLNGVQIGSGAVTAGRSYKAGSTSVAGVWARSPSVSFASSSIDAFISFDSAGKPTWAILSACGNPVKWSKPHLTITKQISDGKGWVKDTTLANGSEAEYLLTVKNDGNAADTNVRVVDQLPANQTYIAGSTVINGVANIDGITSGGINIGTLTADQTIYISFRAKVTVPATKCGVNDMMNTAREDSDKSAYSQDSATSHVTVECKTVTCTALSGPASLTFNQQGVYTAVATDPSLVESYAFSIGSRVVQTGAGNTFAVKFNQAGSTTISVKITPKTNVTDGGSAACSKTVTISEQPQPKLVKCDALTGPVSVAVNEQAVFTAVANDPSLVENYVFSLGGKEVQTSPTNTFAVKISQAGTATIAVRVTPKAGVTADSSATCSTYLKVKEISKTVKCDALTGPSTLKLNMQGVYTAVASDPSLVDAYVFSVAGKVVQNSATNTFAVQYNQAGSTTISAKVVPKAGVTDGGSTNCVKTITVTEESKVTNCEALSVSKADFTLGETTTLTAQASAQNTSITSYEFVIDGKTVQNTAASSYDFKPTETGNHAVVVKVHFANGDVKSGADCEKTVKVKEQPKTPIARCDLLTLSATKIKLGDKLTATVKYTAINGAELKSAVVDFGEDKVTVATPANGSFTADYSYKKSGDFNINATLTFVINGETLTASTGCAGKVTVTTQDVKGATTLPDTGAGSMIGLFAAVTAAGAFLHNVWVRRSFNR